MAKSLRMSECKKIGVTLYKASLGTQTLVRPGCCWGRAKRGRRDGASLVVVRAAERFGRAERCVVAAAAGAGDAARASPRPLAAGFGGGGGVRVVCGGALFARGRRRVVRVGCRRGGTQPKRTRRQRSVRQPRHRCRRRRRRRRRSVRRGAGVAVLAVEHRERAGRRAESHCDERVRPARRAAGRHRLPVGRDDAARRAMENHVRRGAAALWWRVSGMWTTKGST